MVNDGADNSGTGYNQIMAKRSGTKKSGEKTPAKLQAAPRPSSRPRGGGRKPASDGKKPKAKAVLKRTAAAMPAVSPTRSHRSKLQKPGDAGDGTIGAGKASTSAKSTANPFDLLADESTDTDRDGDEAMEASGEDSGVDASDEEDSDDEVELIEDDEEEGKAPPPKDERKRVALSDSDEEVDPDEYEEPSDKQVAYSGEFLRLLRHNQVCGSCGDEGHADARSSECPR